MFDRIELVLARPDGATRWRVSDAIELVRDCARHGVRAVALDGLAFAGVFEVLGALRGHLARTLVTDGRLLDGQLAPLVTAAPDAVHVVVRQPGNAPELARAIRQVQALAAVGVASSLVVSAARIEDALRAAAHAHEHGVDDIVYRPAVPARCSSACAIVVEWDRHVGCAHGRSASPLAAPTHAALIAALRKDATEPA